MGREAWWATVHGVSKELDMTEHLNHKTLGGSGPVLFWCVREPMPPGGSKVFQLHAVSPGVLRTNRRDFGGERWARGLGREHVHGTEWLWEFLWWNLSVQQLCPHTGKAGTLSQQFFFKNITLFHVMFHRDFLQFDNYIWPFFFFFYCPKQWCVTL